MKKKIIIVLSVLTMILSLTACSSNSPAKKEISGEVKNETSKQGGAEMLKELGWTSYSELGLGFYLPTNKAIKKQRHYTDNNRTEWNYTEFILGRNYEYGNTLLRVKPKDLGLTVVTSDSVDFIISDTDKDATLYSETDSYYLYQVRTSYSYKLYLLPKGTSILYGLYTGPDMFKDFEVNDGSGTTYKAGDFFTEETYTAFKESLVYLGN